ncbi:MAG: isochorismatase [Anaerolineales bacterium]
MNTFLTLPLRRQTLVTTSDGYAVWQSSEQEWRLSVERLAIIVCDVWDHHWCRGAEERLNKMVARMNEVLCAARSCGAHIIHAPSDTMAFSGDQPARQRIAGLAPTCMPVEQAHADPPLPIDASDGGCDVPGCITEYVWTREHPAITVDAERDVISDVGLEVYAYLQQQAIELTLLMGVHTNMCILNRSFAIKQLVRWGVPVALLRDLTDAMYNPACAPYVSHEEGTALVIGYIEKHWCPTLPSVALLSQAGA